MTIDKQALRERYSPKPVPKCHICGEEMTIQRMSASRITYGCTGEGDDGYFKFGRTFADEHCEKSRVTVVDVSDPDVLALLDELEAAEKHIAELEAREVTLPPTFWYEHDDLSRDVPVLDKRLVKKAIRAAGIGVKGE
ncbi:ead/Ea22-like family protein [Salmonella enterica]|nr:ead/Ea22-like family protein [Salmonella enterica]EBQ4289089.1 ead/Ea22-like family protein [Salmonella enterica]EBQ4483043.1 ead/Ea22-like family protein [Salmonella enterica]EBQ4500759.1 ead/Ea22-like family protein [Salmonella enterica]EBR2208748.1 ead/Ea22-like family protein [Salmonella enterica]